MRLQKTFSYQVTRTKVS